MTSDKLISFMQSMTRVLWSGAALLAPWLVPIGSAIIFGWSMFQAALTLGMTFGLALVVGVATAAGLETTNIGAAHAAVQLWHGWRGHQGKFWTACGLIVFYIALGILSVTRLPVPVSTQFIAGAMFLLTPVAIISQALTLDLARVRQEIDAKQAREDARAQQRLEQRQAELAIKEKEIALEFEVLKTERYKAGAQVRLARAQSANAGQVTGASLTGGRRWPNKAAFLSDPGRSTYSVSDLVSVGVHERTARRWVETAHSMNGKEEAS